MVAYNILFTWEWEPPPIENGYTQYHLRVLRLLDQNSQNSINTLNLWFKASPIHCNLHNHILK